jgi:hypothetical protein
MHIFVTGCPHPVLSRFLRIQYEPNFFGEFNLDLLMFFSEIPEFVRFKKNFYLPSCREFVLHSVDKPGTYRVH